MQQLLFLPLSIILSLTSIAQTTLLKNFIIIDGSGRPAYEADLRIRDQKIALIGNLIPRSGEKIIEGHHKLILAPGFIDVHSHHDRNLKDSSQYASFLCQGITTLLVGVDGSSHFPIQKFFQDHTTSGIPVNVISFVGHNTLRYEVLGNQHFNRPATKSEIKKMKTLLKGEIKAGAWGLSTGLEYDPGIFSTKEEVKSLAVTAATLDGMYTSHLRSEDVGLEEAIEEIISIGKKTHLPVNISHLKIAIKTKWGRADSILKRLNEARAEGVDITADVYPYDFWLSTLEVLFPKRDFDNKASAEYALNELTPAANLILSRYDAQPDYVGKSIAEIARLLNKDEAETYMHLIKTAQLQKAEESVMGIAMHEEDIKRFIQWPHSTICSDGFGGGRHPRGVGAFPKVLSKYVLQNNWLALELAIHKMTALSAAHFGLEDRGRISQEMPADLVVIDPEEISDHASIADPFVLSTGVKYVWVNGKLTWEHQTYTGAKGGKVIKKKR